MCVPISTLSTVPELVDKGAINQMSQYNTDDYVNLKLTVHKQ